MHRIAAAFVAIAALAGCQTVSAPAGSADTGHLTHRFTDLSRGIVSDEPGFTHIFHFTEVFRETRGVGVRLTRSRICYVVEDECVTQSYDITIPANGSTSRSSSILSSDPAREGYTETYYGRDNNGNEVVLTTIFRASDYTF